MSNLRVRRQISLLLLSGLGGLTSIPPEITRKPQVIDVFLMMQGRIEVNSCNFFMLEVKPGNDR